jgi:hypothetical protein
MGKKLDINSELPTSGVWKSSKQLLLNIYLLHKTLIQIQKVPTNKPLRPLISPPLNIIATSKPY